MLHQPPSLGLLFKESESLEKESSSLSLSLPRNPSKRACASRASTRASLHARISIGMSRINGCAFDEERRSGFIDEERGSEAHTGTTLPWTDFLVRFHRLVVKPFGAHGDLFVDVDAFGDGKVGPVFPEARHFDVC